VLLLPTRIPQLRRWRKTKDTANNNNPLLVLASLLLIWSSLMLTQNYLSQSANQQTLRSVLLRDNFSSSNHNNNHNNANANRNLNLDPNNPNPNHLTRLKIARLLTVINAFNAFPKPP